MDKKYISLETAIDAVTAKNLLAHFDSVEDAIEYKFHRAAERVLAGIPAANVTEVVRCGQCKYWKQRDNREYGLCVKHKGVWLNSDFCSKGECKNAGNT